MAKKIELLNDQQEVVHPLTSADCVIMENGETLDKVMGDGIATPTITHEGTSFQVGVGDSNIEVIDSDVAGMTIKGQSYQNILPKPTTLIMETDEKEFKINDKIDSNIIIDDNIAEIATVKGKTIVNTVQEESASEYVALGQEVSGQGEIVTENTVDGNLKGVTLQGQTLVNTIQEPSDYESVVIGEDLSGQNITIEQDIKGLEGMTLVNMLNNTYRGTNAPTSEPAVMVSKDTTYLSPTYRIKDINVQGILKANKKYLIQLEVTDLQNEEKIGSYFGAVDSGTQQYSVIGKTKVGLNKFIATPTEDSNIFALYLHMDAESTATIKNPMIIEYQEGLENLDIPYFEGTKYFDYSTPRYINGSTLEGQTLVNLNKNPNIYKQLKVGESRYYVLDIPYNIKANQPFTLKLNVKESTVSQQIMMKTVHEDNTNTFDTLKEGSETGIVNRLFTKEKDVNNIEIYIQATETGIAIIENIILLEGDYTNVDIPYFEGMQSVKMPVLKTIGKNLLDTTSMWFDGYAANSSEIKKTNSTKSLIIKVKPNTTYTFTRTQMTNRCVISSFRGNYEDLPTTKLLYNGDSNAYAENPVQFTTFDDTEYVIIYVHHEPTTPNGWVEHGIYQLEEGSTATSYEPYKSNILTVNEEVELRAIGDIKDELDLQTGKLTQRIGEVVLDGSESWNISNNYDDVMFFVVDLPIVKDGIGNQVGNKNNKVNDISWMDAFNNHNTGIFTRSTGVRGLGISVDKKLITSVQELKAWLQSNPITVQYQLATESIKTVDLTVLDQDGNELPYPQLQTPINHITTSSDGLTPVVNIPSTVNYDTIIKPSTQYTLRFNQDEVNTDNPLTVNLGGTEQVVTSNHFTMTTPSTLTHNQLQFSGKGNVVSEVQVIEGDVTGIEYPFFEGMNDVKFSDSRFICRGKNLTSLDIMYDNFTKSVNGVNNTVFENGILHLRWNGNPRNATLIQGIFKPKQQYTFSFWCKAPEGYTWQRHMIKIYYTDGTLSALPDSNTSNTDYTRQIITSEYGKTIERIGVDLNNQLSINQVQLEEGSVATSYEPYKCVEVQQDVDSIPLTSDMFEQGVRARSMGMSLQQCPLTSNTARISSKTLIPVKPNSKYTVLSINTSINHIWGDMYDKDGLVCYDSVLDLTGGISSGTGVFVPHDVHYLYIKIKNADDSAITPSTLDSMNLILQEVPQEIVLRGIGDVKDELDLTRGEYIQRIGEIVLNGKDFGNLYYTKYSVNSHETNTFTNTSVFCVWGIPNKKLGYNTSTAYSFSNCGNSSAFAPALARQGIYSDHSELQNIYIDYGNNNNYTLEDFKTYLQANPITLQYQLATPIIHKVNLTNINKIPSYASKTTYTTQQPSDSLIPNITILSTLNYDVAIKPSTEYTIRANTSDNLTVDLGGTTGTLSNGKVTLTTPATLTHNEVKFSGTGKVKELMVIEGNEIRDNVPFFNGMKDVQMGGIKLVNIARDMTLTGIDVLSTNTNKTQVTYNGTSSSFKVVKFNSTLLNPNTVYTIYLNIIENTSALTNPIKFLYDNDNAFVDFGGKGIKKVVVTTPNVLRGRIEMAFRPCTTSQKVVVQNPMIIEGDWTHLDEIPFIESEMIIEQPIIRSQGKNLFDLETKYFNPSNVTYTKSGTTYTVVGNTSNYNYGQFAWTTADLWFRKLLGQEVTLSVSSISCTNTNSKACVQVRMECTDGSKVYKTISMNDGIKHVTFTIPSNAIDMALQLMSNNTGSPLDSESTLTVSNIQLELGSTVTSYEPYKHQTLYSNRVIGYEEKCYYIASNGNKITTNSNLNSVKADVEGLSIAYITKTSSNYVFWDKDGVFISGKATLDTAGGLTDKDGFIAVPSNAKYMTMAVSNKDTNRLYTDTTVTGELPLRSLPNGVCDTLNLVTGEYVQRVGEVVLDGISHTFTVNGQDSNINTVFLIINSLKVDDYHDGKNCLCCELPGMKDSDDIEHIRVNANGNIVVWLNRNKFKDISANSIKEWLQQNPITVQYELETPIVRKLTFTTKGNFQQASLEDYDWVASPTTANNTLTTRYRTTSANSLPIVYNTHLFSDDFHVRHFNIDAHQDYEYISNMEYGQYVCLHRDKLESDTIESFKKWLAHNPITVGYIDNRKSSESYSNIHKPIFFNDVHVQYLPNNIDIQPQLTLQARTMNSYIMDMMKPNTTYTMKCLAYSNSAKLYVANSTANLSVASNKTFQIAKNYLDGSKNELVLVGQWYEPMIIEGDLTGKSLPYFKDILSSYHDVDEIEVYSVSKNLFDMSKVKPYDESGTYWWNTIIKENEVVSVRSGNIEAGQFGAYIKFNVRPNSTYTLYIEMEKDGEPFNGHIYIYENSDLWGTGSSIGYGNSTIHVRTTSQAKYITIGLNYGKDFPIGTTLVSKNMRLYLGEESPIYIPHSHNTTLIEMPTRLETVKVVRPVIEIGKIEMENGQNYDDTSARRSKDYIAVKPGMILTFMNGNMHRAENVYLYDVNKNYISAVYTNGGGDLIIPKDCYFIRFYSGSANTSDISVIKQQYNPIALNSLPNGVCDEIIMKPNSNKAQLVQRVVKVVLDGSESWKQNATVSYFCFNSTTSNHKSRSNGGMAISRLKYLIGQEVLANNTDGFSMGGSEFIQLCDMQCNTVTELTNKLRGNPLIVYYELATPIIHEIQLQGYPHVYENGTVTFNTDVSHKTVVSYNVNQEQLIANQNETIIRHDKQIDDLYYYIELYLEEIYQMELFRMQVELSL